METFKDNLKRVGTHLFIGGVIGGLTSVIIFSKFHSICMYFSPFLTSPNANMICSQEGGCLGLCWLLSALGLVVVSVGWNVKLICVWKKV